MEALIVIATLLGITTGSIQLVLWSRRFLQLRDWRRKAESYETDLVAVAIVVKDSSVLLVRRASPEGTLGWQFPGATIASEQRLRERVVAEVRNETRVKTKFHRVLGERLHPDTGKFIVYTALEYISGSPRNAQPEENSEVRWVDIRDLRMLVTSDLSPAVWDFVSLFSTAGSQHRRSQHPSE